MLDAKTLGDFGKTALNFNERYLNGSFAVIRILNKLWFFYTVGLIFVHIF